MIRERSIWIVCFSLIVSQLLFGCFSRKIALKMKEKKVPPKMMVLPFSCENSEVGEKITKGFIENIDKKVEVIESKNFKLFLASYSIYIEDYFSSELSTSAFSFAIDTTTQLSPALATLAKGLLDDQEIRTKFYQESGVDYMIVGKAKEQIWGPLEIGYIKTAERSEMKFLELKSGNLLLEEKFHQGVFEIVAPDRIGSKFASKVNKKLKQIRKEVLKMKKAMKKQLKKKNQSLK